MSLNASQFDKWLCCVMVRAVPLSRDDGFQQYEKLRILQFLQLFLSN